MCCHRGVYCIKTVIISQTVVIFLNQKSNDGSIFLHLFCLLVQFLQMLWILYIFCENWCRVHLDVGYSVILMVAPKLGPPSLFCYKQELAVAKTYCCQLQQKCSSNDLKLLNFPTSLVSCAEVAEWFRLFQAILKQPGPLSHFTHLGLSRSERRILFYCPQPYTK